MADLVSELIEVVGEIGRYTGEDPNVVLSKLLNGTRLMAEEWAAVFPPAHPVTEHEVVRFYQTSRTQVYGMAGYNYFNRSRWLLSVRTVEQCMARLPAARLPAARVLDFGAGIGDNLIRLWQAGFRNLVHVDFASYTRDFAAQRYASRDMTVSLCAPDDLAGAFDCIICFDVIEHTPRPDQILTALAQRLTPEGLLCLNVHFEKSADHPMHYDRPAGFDELTHLTGLGVRRQQILTARDLLIDIRDQVERPISSAELARLLQAFPANLDLLLLYMAAELAANRRRPRTHTPPDAPTGRLAAPRARPLNEAAH